MSDVTDLLARWHRGDPDALAEMMPLVYGELHQLAQHYMRREHWDHTLQPTALVHEAYLRLVGSARGAVQQPHALLRRRRARSMRRSSSTTRGGGWRRSGAAIGAGRRLDCARRRVDLRLDLVALDEALDTSPREAPRPARVVELRYFGGLTMDETAEVLGVAPRP